MRAVATVLPFRVNDYVIDELIDWDSVPDDPIFRLTFPQADMLEPDELAPLIDLIRRDAPSAELQRAARAVQSRLNPHPAAQLTHNVPQVAGKPLRGIQHKYPETVLFFPSPGQTCHSYCTYCFRWAQFVGLSDLRFSSNDAEELASYVRQHPEVTSVLLTGGDPLVMKTNVLRRFVEPLLEIEHVESIRFGTKALAYWPARFVEGEDADDLMRLFEEIGKTNKQAAVMGHFSHWRELSTDLAQAAVRRCRSAGAVVRTQAPLVRHVNDDAEVWTRMWRAQLRLGAVPYYMFVERDTGPRGYFEVPLAQALEIYQGAFGSVSGLGRTARGPSMSCTPGKVLVDGVAEVAGEKVFVLKMIQGRERDWVSRPFFARYDADATWIDDLRPAFGHRDFFWEPRLRELLGSEQPWRRADSGTVSLTTFGAAEA